MEIRFLQASDFLEFEATLAEFYQYAGNEQAAEKDVRRLFAKVLDENSNYYVVGAFEGEKMAGMISMTFGESSYKTSAFCWCDDLFVKPAFRHQRIGQLLITAAREHAALRECSNILLGVGEDEAEAEGFYQKNGFINLHCRLWTLPIEKKG